MKYINFNLNELPLKNPELISRINHFDFIRLYYTCSPKQTLHSLIQKLNMIYIYQKNIDLPHNDFKTDNKYQWSVEQDKSSTNRL